MAEQSRATQLYVYVEIEAVTSSSFATQLYSYVESEGNADSRATQVYAYVESELASEARATQLYGYTEIDLISQARATQMAAYVEIVPKIDHDAFRVYYNGYELSYWAQTASLQAQIKSLSVEDFSIMDDTTVTIPALAAWSLTLSGIWERPLDDIIGPDVAVRVSRARTVRVHIEDTNAGIVHYEWRHGGCISGWDINAGAPAEGMLFAYSLNLSGAPVRTVED